MWKGFDLPFIFALNDMYAYATMADTKIVRPIQLRADCVRAMVAMCLPRVGRRLRRGVRGATAKVEAGRAGGRGGGGGAR